MLAKKLGKALIHEDLLKMAGSILLAFLWLQGICFGHVSFQAFGRLKRGGHGSGRGIPARVGT